MRTVDQQTEALVADLRVKLAAAQARNDDLDRRFDAAQAERAAHHKSKLLARNLDDSYQRPYGMPRQAPAEPAQAMDRAPVTKPRRQRKGAGSRPNAAVTAEYQRRLEMMVLSMHTSLLYWMRAAYRQNPPVMAMDGGVDAIDVPLLMLPNSPCPPYPGHARAPRRYAHHTTPHGLQDESDGNNLAGTFGDMHLHGGDGDGGVVGDERPPAAFLQAAFARLRKRWEERFDDAAGKLARWFAQASARRSDEQLRRILKDGGLSVRFTPTKAMRDVMAGTVQANVALIKSIPEQYLTQVEGYVMRSVQTGRDLHQLSNDLRHELGVTKRRAAFIALDQNNKSTSAMTRARQQELGMQAVWVHSHAGKEPRPTHLANDGRPYDPAVGWFDPDPKVRKRVWPGELISCRCFSRTVIPGFKP